jgi:hypothetical protein
VPNKWWEAKAAPPVWDPTCKCEDFECGGDWRTTSRSWCQQWWDEQVSDTTVSFYVASESDHHVGANAESLYINAIQYISTVGLTENDTVMLIRQVNSGGVITSDVVLSAVTTESAIEIKLMQQRGGVGTTLFQTANKKEDYKPEVFKSVASALWIAMAVCKNHPECEWNIHTNPWQTDMYLRGFDGVPTELMYHRDCIEGDIAAAPAEGDNTRTSTPHTQAHHTDSRSS